MQNNKTTGFTLVEILVIILIILIVGTIIIQTQVSTIEKSRLTKSASTIVNLIEEAKNESLKYTDGRQYGLSFNPSTGKITLVSCPTDQTPNSSNCLDTGKSFTPNDGQEITNRPTGNRLLFKPITARLANQVGNPKTSADIITITSNNWSIDIEIPVTSAAGQQPIEKL